MTGYNLPPGVTDSMLPGNRPEDEAWEYYCETKRPNEIWSETHHGAVIPSDWNAMDFYKKEGHEEFTKAIDKDFENWLEDQMNPY